MLSLRALAGMCDQEEYSGKKSPIGKNVKDKKIVAEEWHSPWILAPTHRFLPQPWRNLLVNNLPSAAKHRCEPSMFSHIAQSSSDSLLALPHPAHLGLLAYREQWLITSLSPGGGWGSLWKTLGNALFMHIYSCKTRIFYYMCFWRNVRKVWHTRVHIFVQFRV